MNAINTRSLILALTLISSSYMASANNLDDMAGADLQSVNQFQKFDDQISIGNSWVSGNISDGKSTVGYNANDMTLSVSKLFKNQIYLAAGGGLSYSGNLVNYSSNNVYAQFGYAFLPSSMFQIIPLVSVSRGQMSAFSDTENMNDVYGSGALGLRFELLASSQIKFNADVNGGAYMQNGTITQSDPSTIYGGIINAGASINLRPISGVPWIINVGYDYTSYAGAMVSSSNNFMISTGYTY